MRTQRKWLLAILCMVSLALTLQISFRLFNERKEELTDSMRLTQEFLNRFELNSLQPEADNAMRVEVIRLYQSFPPDKDLYSLSEEIRRGLLREGFSINRYQQLTHEGTNRMEFHAECSPYMLLNLLNNLAGTRMHSLTFDAQTLPARISFQTSPLTRPENIPRELDDILSKQEPIYQDDPPERIYSVTELAGLFPQLAPIRAPRAAPQEQEAETPTTMDKTTLKFVGTAAIDGFEKKIYFKNLRTGQVIGVSSLGITNDKGWRLAVEEETHYIIVHENMVYEILR